MSELLLGSGMGTILSPFMWEPFPLVWRTYLQWVMTKTVFLKKKSYFWHPLGAVFMESLV